MNVLSKEHNQAIKALGAEQVQKSIVVSQCVEVAESDREQCEVSISAA